MEMTTGPGCGWQRLVQGLPLWLGVALGISAWLLLAFWGAAHAQSSCSNPIVCENSKPGNPESEWDISGAGSVRRRD